MKRFIEGVDRHQVMHLPDCLDDCVDQESPVRAVDAFVGMLDSAALGFSAEPETTGRPGYHPGLILGIHLYGYLNQVQSSRRLERECSRKLELICLTGRLKPDFNTFADFRKDNGSAIRMVCQHFVALCRDIDLLDSCVVAIDGSRFKAVNAKAKNYTRGKLRQKLSEIDTATQRNLSELDRANEVLERTGTALPEARSMATTARMPRVVGYNVQTAVEAERHLIGAHEVTMLGYDRDALSMMAVAARHAMAADQFGAIADKDYYRGEEIVACEEAGISVIVPKPITSNAAARGRFDKADFGYDGAQDVYLRPAGEQLAYRSTSQQDGKAIRSYWSGACVDCVIKDKCTTCKQRRIRHWEHEDVLERLQKRLDDDPSKPAVQRVSTRPLRKAVIRIEGSNGCKAHTPTIGFGRNGRRPIFATLRPNEPGGGERTMGR